MAICNLLYLKQLAYTPYDKALLGQIVDKGLPLILGEFSDKHPDSSGKTEYINAPKIMK
jgi:hypothetical protein